MFTNQNITEFFDEIDLFGNLNDQNYIINSIEKDPFDYQPSSCFKNQNKSDDIFITKQSLKQPQLELIQSSVKRHKVVQSIQDEMDNLLLYEENQHCEKGLFTEEKQSSRIQKGKTYAKNYRQRKKQEIKCLQSQNRFLKQKIQDLSFRLKQTQVELNKLKNNQSQESSTFENTKQSYFRQIQLAIQDQNIDVQKLLEIQSKVRALSTFSSKHRMDLLNYFMSELLENLINDISFYFIDSFLEKKGLFRQNQNLPYVKIDEQILMFYDQDDLKKFKMQMAPMSDYMYKLMSNFKGLWKKLYQDYIQIIKQGSMMETLCQPIQRNMRKQQFVRKEVTNALKLELYFEKIKYRKDMRLLRQSWFKEFQREQQMKQNYKNGKKVKKMNE